MYEFLVFLVNEQGDVNPDRINVEIGTLFIWPHISKKAF